MVNRRELLRRFREDPPVSRAARSQQQAVTQRAVTQQRVVKQQKMKWCYHDNDNCLVQVEESKLVAMLVLGKISTSSLVKPVYGSSTADGIMNRRHASGMENGW